MVPPVDGRRGEDKTKQNERERETTERRKRKKDDRKIVGL